MLNSILGKKRVGKCMCPKFSMVQLAMLSFTTKPSILTQKPKGTLSVHNVTQSLLLCNCKQGEIKLLFSIY